MINLYVGNLWYKFVSWILGGWVVRCFDDKSAGKLLINDIRFGDCYMRVYMEMIEYEIAFTRFWKKTEKRFIYRFTSEVRGDGYDKLSKVTQEPVFFPTMPDWTIDFKSRRNHYLSMYVDVIIGRLSELSHE
jgi:hypothetical protein